MRKRIMQLLRTRPYRVAELAELFGVTKNAVRYHLKTLRTQTVMVETTNVLGAYIRVKAYYIEVTL